MNMDMLNFLPRKKTFLWAFYLMLTGVLKMFAGDAMPEMLDPLSLDPAQYIAGGVSFLFMRLGMKNEGMK